MIESAMEKMWEYTKKQLEIEDMLLRRSIDEAIDNGDNTLALFGKSIKRTRVMHFTFYHFYEPESEDFQTIVYMGNEFKGVD